jgi:hypothetical protein
MDRRRGAPEAAARKVVDEIALLASPNTVDGVIAAAKIDN